MNQKLTIGNVFKETLDILKKSYLKIAILLFACFGLFLITFIVFEDRIDSGNPATIVSFIITAFGMTPIIATILCRILYNSSTGNIEPVKELFTIGIKKILPFWGLYFLLVIGMFLCFIPSALISLLSIPTLNIVSSIVIYIVIIFLGLCIGYSFLFLLTGDNGIIESIKKSWELTKKRRWKIFLINLIVFASFFILFMAVYLMLDTSSNFVTYFSINDLKVGSIFILFFVVLVLALYPFMFSFYTAQFVVLKRDKGILETSNLTDGFMEAGDDEVTQNW